MEYITITTEHDSSTSIDDYLPRNTKTAPNLTKKIVVQMQLTLYLKLDIRIIIINEKCTENQLNATICKCEPCLVDTQFDLEA